MPKICRFFLDFPITNIFSWYWSSWLDSKIKYIKKTPKSSKVFEKSKRFHVSGVSHNIRFFEPYPFVTKSAKGKFLVDVDSNKYVDYWMGHWSLILGHAPSEIKQKIQKKPNHKSINGWVVFGFFVLLEMAHDLR